MTVVVAAGIDLGKVLGEGLQSQQAAGDTLVVAEEQKVHARQEADGDLKLGAVEADKSARSHLEEEKSVWEGGRKERERERETTDGRCSKREWRR